MTENDPLAHLRVGDPTPAGWFDDVTSPACLRRMRPGGGNPRDGLVCTRIAHPREWPHIATAEGPAAPSQYVHADGTIHPADGQGPISGVVAIWHDAEATR